jgi:hypothetical protein
VSIYPLLVIRATGQREIYFISQNPFRAQLIDGWVSRNFRKSFDGNIELMVRRFVG